MVRGPLRYGMTLTESRQSDEIERQPKRSRMSPGISHTNQCGTSKCAEIRVSLPYRVECQLDRLTFIPTGAFHGMNRYCTWSANQSALQIMQDRDVRTIDTMDLPDGSPFKQDGWPATIPCAMRFRHMAYLQRRTWSKGRNFRLSASWQYR